MTSEERIKKIGTLKVCLEVTAMALKDLADNDPWPNVERRLAVGHIGRAIQELERDIHKLTQKQR